MVRKKLEYKQEMKNHINFQFKLDYSEDIVVIDKSESFEYFEKCGTSR